MATGKANQPNQEFMINHTVWCDLQSLGVPTDYSQGSAKESQKGCCGNSTLRDIYDMQTRLFECSIAYSTSPMKKCEPLGEHLIGWSSAVYLNCKRFVFLYNIKWIGKEKGDRELCLTIRRSISANLFFIPFNCDGIRGL